MSYTNSRLISIKGYLRDLKETGKTTDVMLVRDYADDMKFMYEVLEAKDREIERLKDNLKRLYENENRPILQKWGWEEDGGI